MIAAIFRRHCDQSAVRPRLTVTCEFGGVFCRTASLATILIRRLASDVVVVRHSSRYGCQAAKEDRLYVFEDDGNGRADISLVSRLICKSQSIQRTPN